MPNRSMRDERQGVDRPKAVPADPATQRKAVADYESGAKREARERLTKQGAAPPAPKASSPTKDLSVEGAARNITGRRRRIDDAIEEAGG